MLETGMQERGEADQAKMGGVNGNGMGHREEQQEKAAREGEIGRWKRAIARLGEAEHDVEERERLVRVVANVCGGRSFSGKEVTYRRWCGG